MNAMAECCRVDDASPERVVTGFLQAEWISMLTDCTSVSIALSQVARGRPRGLFLQFLVVGSVR